MNRSGDDYNHEELFRQLKALATEQRNDSTMGIDLADAGEIVRQIHGEDSRVSDCVATRLNEIAEAVELVRDALAGGGRLLYFGAGTSGRLGVVDAAECPPTFGTDPKMVQGFIAGGKEAMFVAQEGAEDLESNGVEDLESSGAGPGDVVCGIAASGRTPYVHGAVREAARRGCKTIFITTVPAEQVTPEVNVDVMIDVEVGPEVIMGSTRMKSATAQKQILNMISTGAMIRLGKVYENVMVDLMLTNNKLKERAKRILMLLAGINYKEAADILAQADGHVKTALTMSLTGLDPKQSRELLERSGGFIRKALETER